MTSLFSHQQTVTSYWLVTYGGHTFTFDGPLAWNALQKHLRDLSHNISVHFCFQSTNVYSALEALATMHYIYLCFTLQANLDLSLACINVTYSKTLNSLNVQVILQLLPPPKKKLQRKYTQTHEHTHTHKCTFYDN